MTNPCDILVIRRIAVATNEEGLITLASLRPDQHIPAKINKTYFTSISD